MIFGKNRSTGRPVRPSAVDPENPSAAGPVNPSAGRWKSILFNGTLALNCLLCFLWLFENRLNIPPWLQVAGRMHPLVLHFPIVLLILFVLQLLVLPGRRDPDNFLLLLAAFTAAFTAVAGLLLSREPGYDHDALLGHEYSGIFVSLLTFAWYTWYERLMRAKFVVAVFGLGLVVFAGHLGSGITHGEDFLLAPLTPPARERTVTLDEAVVFTDMVQPILSVKCMSCHNSRKAKGELSMESLSLLLKGGKDGAIFDTTSADLGLMMERIHLPPDQKKHMPPLGKPQLSDEEIAILYQWIKHGPAGLVRVASLPETDTLRMLAGALFQNHASPEHYDFNPADEKTIAKLNTDYRVVYPIAAGSPALAVDFYGPAFFSSGQLTELTAVKTQIVSINLDHMPVTNADLASLRAFSNLRTLQLGSTLVTGGGLSQLAGLAHLQSLSLANTKIHGGDLGSLGGLKELRSIYVWNTAVTEADSKTLRGLHPDLHVETGSHLDTVHVRLNPPILRNDVVIIDTPIDLRLRHVVPGAAIHYTLDGSDPDPLQSPVYRGPVKISGMTTLKARAYKQGWLPSEVLQYQFYHSSFHPDTIILRHPPDSLYKGKGSKTLYNREKGDLNFGSDKWLGFHKFPMDCLLRFDRPVQASAVAVSSLVDRASLVLPPLTLDIYGGTDPLHLHMLAHLSPRQPDSTLPGYLTYYECHFPAAVLRYIRIAATPVVELPKALVTPKNKSGWFFADEIFVN